MNYFKTALLLAAMTALFLSVGWLIGGTGGAVLALAFAIGTNVFAYWNSDKMVLRMHKARPATRQSAPEYFALIEKLAAQADLPMPAVYIIDEAQPNAFATGRNPDNAAVAATTGLLQSLNREELAGVMAHELAHVKNRDTLIMTIAATVAGAIAMLAQFGFFFGGNRERGGLGIVGAILAMILAPLAAMMIQMLISRTREYSADRLGGQICGNPLWLASALNKIARAGRGHEMASAEQHPATAHMFIINPLAGRRMDGLFTTHPNVENRIAALREQAAAMGQNPGMSHGADGAQTSQPETRDERRRWGIPRTRKDGRQGPWS